MFKKPKRKNKNVRKREVEEDNDDDEGGESAQTIQDRIRQLKEEQQVID
jgi:hypothetical protein